MNTRLFHIFFKISKSIRHTDVHFASFLSGGFITAIVVKSPEKKLAKRTFVDSLGALTKHQQGYSIFRPDCCNSIT